MVFIMHIKARMSDDKRQAHQLSACVCYLEHKKTRNFIDSGKRGTICIRFNIKVMRMKSLLSVAFSKGCVVNLNTQATYLMNDPVLIDSAVNLFSTLHGLLSTDAARQ